MKALNANHSTAGPESDGVRPPCRTAAVAEVSSANSGHCSAIPGTVAILWEPAASCADVPGAAPATVLPTTHTFPATEPSIGMGVTLERGLGLDQSKTPAWRALGALPRQARRTVPSTDDAMTPPGVRRTPAQSLHDRGCRPELLLRLAPHLPVHHSVLSTVIDHCKPPIWGEDDDF